MSPSLGAFFPIQRHINKGLFYVLRFESQKMKGVFFEGKNFTTLQILGH
jgi:hypothetical protein